MIPKTNLLRFTRPAARLRTYSTMLAPVSLHYNLARERQDPKENDAPLIFLHGLFGWGSNFMSTSTALAEELNKQVYRLDLRNHGASPHSPVHNYEEMAADVELFIKKNGIGPGAIIIGHSMGAKVAMAIALRSPSLISAIIAVENAPIEAALPSAFGRYVRAMRKIEDQCLEDIDKADAILAEVEPSTLIRKFLLHNLERNPRGHLVFRFPLGTLTRELDSVAAFPYHPDKVRFEKKALFVRGTQSPYIPDEAIPVIGRFFPLFSLKDIDAGHWVISEKPKEFKRIVIEFVKEVES